MNYNTRSPAVKRLMKEAQELQNKTEFYYAQPLEDNIFEWHFTIRGPSDSDFEGGVYHGRILLPAEYPMKPPSITFLTPNGRFRTNEKICLSISGHHPETWLPSWSIRTALLALIGFMPTFGDGAIGSLDYTSDERKTLAKKSTTYSCERCGVNNANALLQLSEESQKINEEAKELAAQIDFKNTKQTGRQSNTPSESVTTENKEITIDNNEQAIRQRCVTTNVDKFTNEENRNNIEANNEHNKHENSTKTETSTCSIIIITLMIVFLFLFIRRLYLLFGHDEVKF